MTKAASPSASQSSGAASSSSLENGGLPVDESDQAKLHALKAARDCKKCQWNHASNETPVKGCPECMGFWYQRYRLTQYNLTALQAQLKEK